MPRPRSHKPISISLHYRSHSQSVSSEKTVTSTVSSHTARGESVLVNAQVRGQQSADGINRVLHISAGEAAVGAMASMEDSIKMSVVSAAKQPFTAVVALQVSDELQAYPAIQNAAMLAHERVADQAKVSHLSYIPPTNFLTSSIQGESRC